MSEEYEPPTISTGNIPQVTPGVSGGKVVEGDFPLDQIVIDRMVSRTTMRCTSLIIV